MGIFNYLPSRKLVVAVLALLLAGGGLFLVLVREKSPEGERKVAADGNGALSAMVKKNQADSDGDGLNDWEEVLWKTDKSNPDSDGDGTPDGEEVKLGRDPAKAGPDDVLKDELRSGNTAPPPGGATEGLSMTESLARNLLSGYLAAKQSKKGGKLDESTKENLVQGLLSGLNGVPNPDAHKLSDLKISYGSGKESLRVYGNKLGAIMKKYSEPYSPGMELLIFKSKVEAGEEDGLKEIGNIVSVYENLAKDCLELEVPAPLASAHLGLINSFSRNREISVNLMNFPNDPLASIISLKRYYDTQAAMIDSFLFIKKHFADNGIYFSKDEPAFFITGQLK